MFRAIPGPILAAPAEIGPTVFSVRNAEQLPMIISASTRQKLLDMGLPDDIDEVLQRIGYIVVDDALLAGSGPRFQFEVLGGNLSITTRKKNRGR